MCHRRCHCVCGQLDHLLRRLCCQLWLDCLLFSNSN
nr:MAG TPA: hypothetical protein [Caudoviricetes sp.]